MRHHIISIEANPNKGIWLALLAYFFVAMIGICEKAVSHTVPITTVLFFQNFTCLVLLIPQLVTSKANVFKTKHAAMFAVRIISGLSCYAVLFYIIRFIPISEALIYQFSGALWIPLIMLIWFGTRFTKLFFWSTVIGFMGILLVLKPHADMLGSVAFLGVLCGILQAFSVIGIRHLSLTEPNLRILFYYFFIGSLVTAPMLITHWLPLKLHDLLFLCGVGISTYVSQKLIVIALQYANATTLAPISYTSILFSGMIGWWVWHETPTLSTLVGMGLIITGCLLPLWLSKTKKQLAAIESKL